MGSRNSKKLVAKDGKPVPILLEETDAPLTPNTQFVSNDSLQTGDSVERSDPQFINSSEFDGLPADWERNSMTKNSETTTTQPAALLLQVKSFRMMMGYQTT